MSQARWNAIWITTALAVVATVALLTQTGAIQ
jgi:hypothetical protein